MKWEVKVKRMWNVYLVPCLFISPPTSNEFWPVVLTAEQHLCILDSTAFFPSDKQNSHSCKAKDTPLGDYMRGKMNIIYKEMTPMAVWQQIRLLL